MSSLPLAPNYHPPEDFDFEVISAHSYNEEEDLSDLEAASSRCLRGTQEEDRAIIVAQEHSESMSDPPSSSTEVIYRWLTREFEVHHHHWDWDLCCVIATTITMGIIQLIFGILWFIKEVA